ncbi:MAG: sulfurtransferase [Steroidobacteraceae bacterium]
MAQHWHTLVAAATLHQHLHDGNLVIVDCRFDLGQPEAGRHAYRAGHLPGAAYAHLNEDLSGTIALHTGRHPLPDIKTFIATLGRWGIDNSKQVVAYDADNGAMAAARLWWLLRWLGHEHVAVLDGGLKDWQKHGLELSNSAFEPAAGEFIANINAEWLVTADTVAEHAVQRDWRVLDARAPERYAGKIEPLDPVAGHVPGAINYPFANNLTSDGRFLPADMLRSQFLQALNGVTPRHVINMCGSGVTACHNLLAMEIAGLHGAKLYAGSWSEWISNNHRPVAIGHHS